MPDSIHHRAGAISALAALLLLAGCGRDPVAEQGPKGPRADGCLQRVSIAKLEKAIRQCDAVVAAHAQDPQPRNERALLLSLAGRNRAACRDSLAAAALLAKRPASPPADPMMVEDIQLRNKSCLAWRQSRGMVLTTPPAGDAPSAAAAGAGAP